jgi:hypothetical protein
LIGGCWCLWTNIRRRLQSIDFIRRYLKKDDIFACFIPPVRFGNEILLFIVTPTYCRKHFHHHYHPQSVHTVSSDRQDPQYTLKICRYTTESIRLPHYECTILFKYNRSSYISSLYIPIISFYPSSPRCESLKLPM